MNDLTNIQKGLLATLLTGPDARLKTNMTADKLAMCRMLCPQYLAEYGDHFQLTRTGKKVAEEWKEQIDHDIQDAQVNHVEAKKTRRYFTAPLSAQRDIYMLASAIKFEFWRVQWHTIGDQVNLLAVSEAAGVIRGAFNYNVMCGVIGNRPDDASNDFAEFILSDVSEKIDTIREMLSETKGDGECDDQSIEEMRQMAVRMMAVIRDRFQVVQHV